jgi:hypothetical protein
MKTIYINENILNNNEFRKGVLLNALPSDIVDIISKNKTSLGNNPSIPDVFDTPFLLKAAEARFEECKTKLKEIGEINDVDDTDMYSMLSSLIKKCKELETPYRNELERVCTNYVIDLFAVPEETVDIVVKITDKVDFNNTTINLDPIDGDDDIEFNSLDDAISIKGEVYKRRLLDALCMGGAMDMSNCMHLFEETLNKIDPSLIDLYGKIIALNDYLLFEKEDLGMTDENKMQLGTVEVSLGNDENKVRIDAQGVIFPILLCELIRGFIELFISHGLPKDRSTAMSVLGKSDFLKAEPWDMKLGPYLWKLFSNSLNDINSTELPYLLKRISSLHVDKFNYLMKEIFAKTKRGKEIMAKYSFKAKNDIEYDKFVDKMSKLKQDKGIITDEFIHPEEL